jgi:tetratricopeptide (TPR) repeat protein
MGHGAWRSADSLVLGVVVGLLTLGPLSELAANRLPRSPRPAAVSLTGADAPVRALPVGLPEGHAASGVRDVSALAGDVLGRDAAITLQRLLTTDTATLPVSAEREPPHVEDGVTFNGPVHYPYRYPAMRRLIDGSGASTAEELTALGAALTVLSARRDTEGLPAVPNAGAAAYAVLDRARQSGWCDAQLNLLLLVASDEQPRDRVVDEEARRTDEACPNDPTGRWVVGQYQSQRATQDPAPDSPGDPVPANAQARAAQTFSALRKRYPGSADVLAGVADADLRHGYRLRQRQPFTARMHLRRAEMAYRAAMTEGGLGAGSGLARTHLWLGHAKDAAATAASTARGQRTAGRELEVLLDSQEAAGDFASAAAIGRDLVERGSDAYPSGPPLYPSPGVYTLTWWSDMAVLGPVSRGSADAARLTTNLQPPPGGAGAQVEDVSFIPRYRDDGYFTLPGSACPEFAWRRAALLSGAVSAAAAGQDADDFEEFRGTNPDRPSFCGPRPDDMAKLLRAELGEGVEGEDWERRQLGDRRQNLWRWARDLRRAEVAAEAWVEAEDDDHLAHLRLGEVRYLRGNHDGAAAAFATAARRARSTTWNDDLSTWQATLARSAALRAAGRDDETFGLLRALDDQSTYATSYYLQERPDETAVARGFAVVAYYARAHLGDAMLTAGRHSAASDAYAAAEELVPVLEGLEAGSYRPDAVYANHAVALLAVGDVDRADRLASQAVGLDPESPAYLMTAGYAAALGAQPSEAVRLNRRALASDAGAFAAANDLGVQLAKLGRDGEAVEAFRQAVDARPDYALGWFNLGVHLSRQGPFELFRSQGALARAFRLDPDLADRERRLLLDSATYRTGLDVSKPLPPEWSLAEAVDRRATGTAGLLAAALGALALARGTPRPNDHAPLDKMLGPLTARLSGMRTLSRARHPAWSLLAICGILGWPVLVVPGPGATAAVTVLVGILTLATAALRSRAVVARSHGGALAHRTWVPGVLVGVLTAPFGGFFAPGPVVAGEDRPTRIHMAGPVTLSAVAAVLLVESAWLRTPVTSFLATACLVLAASALTPVRPLDGARMGAGGVVAGASLLGLALLAALQLL